jgi:hypothetical protein
MNYNNMDFKTLNTIAEESNTSPVKVIVLEESYHLSQEARDFLLRNHIEIETEAIETERFESPTDIIVILFHLNKPDLLTYVVRKDKTIVVADNPFKCLSLFKQRASCVITHQKGEVDCEELLIAIETVRRGSGAYMSWSFHDTINKSILSKNKSAALSGVVDPELIAQLKAWIAHQCLYLWLNSRPESPQSTPFLAQVLEVSPEDLVKSFVEFHNWENTIHAIVEQKRKDVDPTGDPQVVAERLLLLTQSSAELLRREYLDSVKSFESKLAREKIDTVSSLYTNLMELYGPLSLLKLIDHYRTEFEELLREIDRRESLQTGNIDIAKAKIATLCASATKGSSARNLIELQFNAIKNTLNLYIARFAIERAKSIVAQIGHSLSLYYQNLTLTCERIERVDKQVSNNLAPNNALLVPLLKASTINFDLIKNQVELGLGHRIHQWGIAIDLTEEKVYCQLLAVISKEAEAIVVGTEDEFATTTNGEL